MSTKITNRTKTTATLTITLDEAALKPFVQMAYDRLRSRVKAAGFRPGKAPNNVVERELGSETVQSEVIDVAVTRSYADSVLKEDLRVVAQPKVELKTFVPYSELTFEAEVALLPEVTLGDYKSIRVKPKPLKIDKKDIDEVVTDLQRRLAERVPAVRAAKLGDEVKFDFEGSQDGKNIPGATSKGFTLKLGSGQFIPGFEEELVGLKVGDDKSFTITFPKDYHEASLAGQPVVFKVKVHEVTELKEPKVDAEFAAKIGPFTSVDELRDDITQQLSSERQAEAQRNLHNEVLEKVVAQTKMEVPETLIEQQQARLKADLEHQLSHSGLTMEAYLQAQGLTAEQLDKQLRPEAEKRVKGGLVMSEVAKAEKLKVDKAEIDAEIEEMRVRYTDPHVLEHLDHDHTRDDVHNNLMSQKVIEKLTEYATQN